MPDALYESLARAGSVEGEIQAGRIRELRAQMGSPTLDLLLFRTKEALDEGAFAEAVTLSSVVIENAPEEAEPWHLRAVAFWRLGRYGMALSDLGRVLAIDPRHFDALGGLATILEEIDRPAAARRVWARLLEVWPGHPQAQEAIDRLDLRLGRFDI